MGIKIPLIIDKIIFLPRDPDFRMEMFKGGPINCLYKVSAKSGFNEIRCWLQKHLESIVIIKTDYPYYYLAFNSPDDAIQFATAWGESTMDIK